MSLFIRFTNYLFQIDSIFIYYFIIKFNDIFTVIFYMMDELIEMK